VLVLTRYNDFAEFLRKQAPFAENGSIKTVLIQATIRRIRHKALRGD